MELQSGFEETSNDILQKLNEEFREAVLPVTIFVGVEAVLGLLGNTFVLLVFLLRYPQCTYRYYVLFLASIDILSCFTTVPGEIITQLNWYDYSFPAICKTKSFFNVFTISADAMCLLLIAIDRYRNQCQPDGWQFQPKHAKQTGLLIFLTALVMAFPCSILWGVEEMTHVDNGVSVNVSLCEKDERYANTYKPMAYSFSIAAIVSLSLVTMVILYLIVARDTFQRGRTAEERRLLVEDRHDRSDTNVRENTLVMGVVTIVFVITTITYFTLLSLITDNVLQELSNSGKAVYFFFFRLYFIHHVINPVVYGFLDPEFRSASANVFRSVCRCD